MKKIKKIVALVVALVLCMSFGTNVSATEGSDLLFAGGTDVSYESEDASWLLEAADEDVITLVYTCTDSTHAGWGILGWGATVDDVWKEGPSLSADATDATASIYWTMTAKEMKDALGIKDNSVVSYIKLGAWNGGKIEGLYISTPDKAPSAEEAKNVDESLVTEKEALPELTGEYLYMFTEAPSFKIYPFDFNPTAIPMRTITLTVEVESNGPFNGALGTCVADWAWSMPTFESDENNCATVTWYLTPWLNNIDFMIWWMGGTQIGIKSITVETDIDWHALYAEGLRREAENAAQGGSGNTDSTTPSGLYSVTMEANGNHNKGLTVNVKDYCPEFEEGDTISVSAKITSTSGYYNGCIGGNDADGNWQQSANNKLYGGSGTTTWTHELTNASDSCMIQFWYVEAGTVTIEDVEISVVESTTDTPDADTPDTDTPDTDTDADTEATPTNEFTCTLHADYSGDGNETYTFTPFDYIEDLAVGDQVEITIEASGDSSVSGYYGYSFAVAGNSSEGWASKQLETWESVDLTDTLTVTIPWDGVEYKVERYAVGGSDTAVKLTFQKVVQ